MAKAKPQSPRTTPAAQEQGQDQQDTNAQGTTAAQGDAATDNAAPESGGQSSGGTGAELAGEGAASDQVGNDPNTDVVILGAGPAAAASAALATVAQVLAATEQAAPAAPEGPVRDEQGRLEYEVVSPLNNGKRHEIGDRVWLSDEDAGPLLGHTVKPYTPEAAADEDEGAAHA
ncbi:hypothetical protein [Ideonella paludis]|uniref:Uncharacterized protein n=1 Tax=Ideonella paludis TaxID=1233411 RepID=A0ABS5DZZ2_9BURK|nr:hypothetical protein [Ideonella paludis]MBQ0936712.1 hypothetical protein [Ideonella paludis]